MVRPSSLERAFELARTGKYATSGKVVEALEAEGYDARQVEGRELKRQLTDLCRAAQGKPPAQRGGNLRSLRGAATE